MVPLLTVEDAFYVTGRGLVVILERLPQNPDVLPLFVDVDVVRDDAPRRSVSCRFTMAVARVNGRSKWYVELIFRKIGKSELPKGAVLEIPELVYDQLYPNPTDADLGT